MKTNKFSGLNALDLENFIKQLDYLQKKYCIIDHNILMQHLESNMKLPSNCVLLTFDDGYIDIYNYVLPVLLERNLKGLFYVPNYFKSKKLLQVNVIHLLLSKRENIKLYLKYIKNFVSKAETNKKFNDYCNQVIYSSRYDCQEVELLKQLLQFILPETIRSKILSELLKKFIEVCEDELFELYYCSKLHLNEMISYGMHIGGHGNNHLWHNTLSDEDQEKEVFESLNFLNTLSKQDFYSFSYPYGGYNQFSIELMKKYDFKFAFTTELNSFNQNVFSKFEIPRFDTNDTYPFNNLV
ncbi:polysaccharide deacetylase family protein [Aquirufa nivalisilvae]